MINLLDSNPINGHSFMNDLKKEFDKTITSNKNEKETKPRRKTKASNR